jgi:predicted lipid-binding transport protein (Tim44 family)
MRRQARFLTAIAALAFVLAPAMADARPGGGFSSGSRGSRTYSAPPSTRTAPGTPSQMDRSMTQPTRPAAPVTPGQAVPQAQGSRFGGGFMAGMMGGLIGVGLGGLLFGNGLFGGISGFAGVLGLLLQVALVIFAVRFIMKLVRQRNRPAMAGGPNPRTGMGANGPAANTYARQAATPASGGYGGGSAPAATSPIQVTDADFSAFDRTLKEVNAAWSRRDEAALGRLATPEMAGYFANDLRDLASRNWHNETRDVQLEQGDLSEAWREGATEYATVAMRFSLVDVTRDLATNAVVEGDPERRQTATELWTFARQGGGAWRVSAVQQAS